MPSLAPDRRFGSFVRWSCTLVSAAFVVALIVTCFRTYTVRLDQHRDYRIGLDGVKYTFHDRSSWTRRLAEGYRVHDAMEFELGHFVSDGNNWPGESQWFVRVPWSYPILLLGLPAIGLWIWRFRFHRPGVCSHCGYDLAGQQQRKRGFIVCPECGTRQVRRTQPENAKRIQTTE